jgi:hypothetical protein
MISSNSDWFSGGTNALTAAYTRSTANLPELMGLETVAVIFAASGPALTCTMENGPEYKYYKEEVR